MPRSRASLTDKEERILVQAQLMGLSTASMIKIGNRLRALEREREEIERIRETCQGFVWDEHVDSNKFVIKTPEGHTVEAIKGKSGRSGWHRTTWKYDIAVSKPGTRMKPRLYKDKDLHIESEWVKRLMPAKSKELYALIRWCKNSMQYESHI
jgi:hypothetical protein